MTTLGELVLELKLDPSQYYKSLEDARRDAIAIGKDIESGFSSTNLSLKPKVDDSALTKLNKHLDLKVKHFTQVQNLFTSKPLTPHTNLEPLDRLDAKLNQVSEKLNRVRKDSAAGVQVTSSQGTSQGESDFSQVGDRFSKTMEKAVSKGMRPNRLGGMLGGLMKLTVGNVFKGAFEGIGAELSKDLGTGLADGVKKEMSFVVGSFDLIGNELGSELIKGLMDVLGRDGETVENALKDILGRDNVAREGAAVRGRQATKQRNTQEQAREQIEDEYESVRSNIPAIKKRSQSAQDARAKLQAQEKAVQKKINDYANSIGLGGLEKQLESVSKEIDKLTQTPAQAKIAHLRKKQNRVAALISVAEEKAATGSPEERESAQARLKPLRNTQAQATESINTAEQKAATDRAAEVKAAQARLAKLAHLRKKQNRVADLVNIAEEKLIIGNEQERKAAQTMLPRLNRTQAQVTSSIAVEEEVPTDNSEEIRAKQAKEIKLLSLNRKRTQVAESIKFAKDTAKNKFKDSTDRINEEDDKIFREERAIERLVAPVEAMDLVQVPKGFKTRNATTNRARNRNSQEAQNISSFHKQVFDQVVAESGVTATSEQIPQIVATNLPEGGNAAYFKDTNTIGVSPEMLEAINQGKVTAKQMETLVHELRHAVQSDFGSVGGEDVAIEMLQPTFEEQRKHGRRIEESTAGGRGGSEEYRRATEADAYTFADRHAPKIFEKVNRSQAKLRLENNVGVGGGKLETKLDKAQVQVLGTLKKIGESAEVNVGDEIRTAIANMNKSSEKFKASLDQLKDVELLPVEEIEALQDDLQADLKAAIAEMLDHAQNFKQQVAAKPAQVREQMVGSLGQFNRKKTLVPLATEMGIENADQLSKKDLIQKLADGDLKKLQPRVNAMTRERAQQQMQRQEQMAAAAQTVGSMAKGTIDVGRRIASVAQPIAQSALSAAQPLTQAGLGAAGKTLPALPAAGQSSQKPFELPAVIPEREAVLVENQKPVQPAQMKEAQLDLAESKKTVQATQASVKNVAQSLGKATGAAAKTVQAVVEKVKAVDIDEALGEAKSISEKFWSAYASLNAAIKDGDVTKANTLLETIKENAARAKSDIGDLTKSLGEKAKFGSELGGNLANKQGQISRATNQAENKVRKMKPKEVAGAAIDVDVWSEPRGGSANYAMGDRLQSMIEDLQKQLLESVEQGAASFSPDESLGEDVAFAFEDIQAKLQQLIKSLLQGTNGIDPEAQAQEAIAGIENNLNKFEGAENNINNRQSKAESGVAQSVAQATENLRSPNESILSRVGRIIRAENIPAAIKEFKGLKVAAGLALRGMIAFAVISIAPKLLEIADAATQAAMEFQRFERSLDFTSSSSKAVETLADIRGEAKKLGFDLKQAIGGQVKLQAAAQGTPMAGEATDQMGEALRQGGAVYGLGAEQQERIFTASGQIMSKGKLSAEEIRGQLGESLPGAFQIAARAMSVTTSELDGMLQRGEVLSEQFIPKFAAQLSSETASGIPGAMQSAQAATGRLNNALYELQVGLGKAALPAKSMGLNVAANAMDLLAKNAQTLMNIFTAVAVTVGGVFVKSLAPSMGMMVKLSGAIGLVTGALRSMMPALMAAAKNFLWVTLITEAFTLLGNATKDGGGKVRDFANQTSEGLQNYLKLVGKATKGTNDWKDSLSGVKAPSLLEDTLTGGALKLVLGEDAGRGAARVAEQGIQKSSVGNALFDFSGLGLLARGSAALRGESYNGLVTQADKQANDMNIAAGSAIQTVDATVQEANAMVGMDGKVVSDSEMDKLNKLDAKLAEIQAKRRALLPGDKSSLNSLNAEEQKLLKLREVPAKTTNTLKNLLSSQLEGLKDAQTEIEEKLSQGGLSPDEQKGLEGQYEQVGVRIKGVQGTIDNLNKAMAGSVDTLGRLARSFAEIQGALEKTNQTIERSASAGRKAIASQQINGALTTEQAGYARTLSDQDGLKERIEANQKAMRELNNLFTNPEMLKAMGSVGIQSPDQINPTVLQERVKAMPDSEQKSLLENAANYKSRADDLQTQTADLDAQLEESKASFIQQMRDLNKSVNEFYRDMARGAADMDRSTRQIQLDTQISQAKTNLQRGLSGFGDRFFGDLVDQLLSLTDLLMEPLKNALNVENQVAQLQSGLQQNQLQAQGLTRQLPGATGAVGGSGDAYGANPASVADNTVRVVRTGKTDEYGGEELQVQLIRGGQVVATERAASGTPSNQTFEVAGQNTQGAGSLAPIPEGAYDLGTVDRGDFGGGLGETWIDILDPNTGSSSISGTGRGSFGIHEDANRLAGSPGSAGCVVFYDSAATDRVANWVQSGARQLQVDWGLGTFSSGIQAPSPSAQSAPNGGMQPQRGAAPAAASGGDFNARIAAALQIAIPEVKNSEAFRSTPYDDGTGVMTIGYGETREDVVARGSISESEASALAAQRLEHNFLRPALEMIPEQVRNQLSAGQMAAIGSFAYNTGVGSEGFPKSAFGSSLIRGDVQGAQAALPTSYINPGSNVEQGLRNRRQRELEMFTSSGSATATVMPTYNVAGAIDLNATASSGRQRIDEASGMARSATSNQIQALQQQASGLDEANRLQVDQTLQKIQRALENGQREVQDTTRSEGRRQEDLAAQNQVQTPEVQYNTQVRQADREYEDASRSSTLTTRDLNDSLKNLKALRENVSGNASPEMQSLLPGIDGAIASTETELAKLTEIAGKEQAIYQQRRSFLDAQYQYEDEARRAAAQQQAVQFQAELDQMIDQQAQLEIAQKRGEAETLRGQAETLKTQGDPMGAFDLQNQAIDLELGAADQESAARQTAAEATRATIGGDYDSKLREASERLRSGTINQSEFEGQKQLLEEIRDVSLENVTGQLAQIGNEADRNRAALERQRVELEKNRAALIFNNESRLFESNSTLNTGRVDMLRRTGRSGDARQLQRTMAVDQVGFDFKSQIYQLDQAIASGDVLAETATKIRANLEELNQVNLGNVQRQLDREDENLAFNSRSRVFDSQASLGSAVAQGYRGMGWESQANDLDRQVAIEQTNFSYQGQLREIDQAVESGDLLADAAAQAKANLEALNQVQLNNIDQQFSLLTPVVGAFSQSFEGFFSGVLSGTQSIEEAFKGMLDSLLSSLAQLAAKMIVSEIFGSLFGAKGGGMPGLFGGGAAAGGAAEGGGGFIGTLLGGLFGDGGGLLGGGGGGVAAPAAGGGGMGGIASIGMSLIGSLFGGGIGGFAEGGMVDAMDHRDYREGNGAIARALHKEGSNAVLAALTPGEMVLTVKQAQRYQEMGIDKVLNFKNGGMVPGGGSMATPKMQASGGINVNAPVTVNTGGGGQNVDVSGFQRVIDSKIQEAIIRESRRGGSLNR